MFALMNRLHSSLHGDSCRALQSNVLNQGIQVAGFDCQSYCRTLVRYQPGNHVAISSTTCFLSPRRVHAVSAALMKHVGGAHSLDAFPNLTRFALLACTQDDYDTITLLTGFVQCHGMDSIWLLPCMLFIYDLHNMSQCRWLRLELRPWRVLLRSR